MGFAPIRRTRLCQPRGDGVDWSNPVTRGLRALVKGGGAYDYVSNKHLVATGLSTVVSEKGLANKVSVSAGSGILIPFEISGALSIFALVSRDSDTATSGPGMVAAIASNKTANQSTYWESSVGSGFGAGADLLKPRFNSESVGIGSIYVDGNLTSGNNPSSTQIITGRMTAVAFVTPSGAPLSGSGAIVLHSVVNSYCLDGKMPLVALWDRVLSASEVASLSSNPWQVFL